MLILIVLSSWQGHFESSLGSFDDCRLSAKRPLTLRPSQPTWAVSPPAGYFMNSLVIDLFNKGHPKYFNKRRHRSIRSAHNDIRHSIQLVDDIFYRIHQVAARVAKLVQEDAFVTRKSDNRYEQVGSRPDGRCDTWPSRIIIDYILTQFHIYV